jgi:hypothetical protein
MNNINTDKLYNFISQAFILFLLFLIIYIMYIDFIREKISNKKIYQSSLQEKFNNLISNNEEKITFDKNDSTGLTLQNMKRKNLDVIEDFGSIDPDLKYIIKRNYNNISNAKCISGDYNDVENNKCYMAINIFYPTQTYLKTSINIYPLPDSTSDNNKNKKTFYFSIKDENGIDRLYNDYIKPDDYNIDNVINLGYKSNYFNFSNINNINNTRKFDITQPLESKIIQYFARCMKYATYVSKYNSNDINIVNAILNNNQSEINNLDSESKQKITDAKQSIINSLQNMLLLKSGYDNYFRLPTNIHNIKQQLIKYYEPIFNDDDNKYPDSDLIITDTSELILLIDPKTKSDDINNITIYSMIFKININIQLINLKPNLKDEKLDSTLLTSLTYLDNLEYAKNNNNIYSYVNTISFPIALPFNLPTKDVSDNTWYDDIKTYISTLIIDNQLQQRVEKYKNGIDSLGFLMNNINNIKNDINKFSNITRIFAYYEPENPIDISKSGNFYFFIIFNNISTIETPTLVFSLNNQYNPNFCEDSNSDLYDRKCLPRCPTGYNIDLGLVCLKSDISNFTPQSDFCAQLNSLKPTEIKNSILQGLIDGCNLDNINNKSNESLFNINDIKGIQQINKNTYVLNSQYNDTSLLSSISNDGDDNSIDSTFSTSFNNVNTKTVQHFDNINIPSLQSMSTRKDRIRYNVKSKEETKPEINNQTGKKIVHFSPFLN